MVALDNAASGLTCVDSEMSQASDPRKRPIPGSSSDDGSVVNSKNSKVLSKKAKKTGVNDPRPKELVVNDAGPRKAAASQVVSRRNVSSSAAVVPAKKGGGVAKKVGAVAAAAIPRGSRLPSGVASAARLAMARLSKK